MSGGVVRRESLRGVMTVFHVRLLPLRTLSHLENNEGRKTKSVSISLQDLLFMRSIKTDLSETNI